QMSLERAFSVFFFQAEDGIRDRNVTGVQTCALPISFRTCPSVSPDRVAFGATGIPSIQYGECQSGATAHRASASTHTSSHLSSVHPRRSQWRRVLSTGFLHLSQS